MRNQSMDLSMGNQSIPYQQKSPFRGFCQTFLSSLIFLINSSMKTNESGRFKLI